MYNLELGLSLRHIQTYLNRAFEISFFHKTLSFREFLNYYCVIIIIYYSMSSFKSGWALEKSLGPQNLPTGRFIYILIYIIMLYIYINKYFFVRHRGPQLALEPPSTGLSRPRPAPIFCFFGDLKFIISLFSKL